MTRDSVFEVIFVVIGPFGFGLVDTRSSFVLLDLQAFNTAVVVFDVIKFCNFVASQPLNLKWLLPRVLLTSMWMWLLISIKGSHVERTRRRCRFSHWHVSLLFKHAQNETPILLLVLGIACSRVLLYSEGLLLARTVQHHLVVLVAVKWSNGASLESFHRARLHIYISPTFNFEAFVWTHDALECWHPFFCLKGAHVEHGGVFGLGDVTTFDWGFSGSLFEGLLLRNQNFG